jgi:hypothetical protein
MKGLRKPTKNIQWGFWIWGFHTGGYEEFYVVYSVESQLDWYSLDGLRFPFWSVYSCVLHDDFLVDLPIDPEDGSGYVLSERRLTFTALNGFIYQKSEHF